MTDQRRHQVRFPGALDRRGDCVYAVLVLLEADGIAGAADLAQLRAPMGLVGRLHRRLRRAHDRHGVFFIERAEKRASHRGRRQGKHRAYARCRTARFRSRRRHLVDDHERGFVAQHLADHAHELRFDDQGFEVPAEHVAVAVLPAQRPAELREARPELVLRDAGQLRHHAVVRKGQQDVEAGALVDVERARDFADAGTRGLLR
jgi:hypothetical protein